MSANLAGKRAWYTTSMLMRLGSAGLPNRDFTVFELVQRCVCACVSGCVSVSTCVGCCVIECAYVVLFTRLLERWCVSASVCVCACVGYVAERAGGEMGEWVDWLKRGCIG